MRQQPLQAPVSRHTLPVQPALAAKLKNYDQAALNSSPQVIFKTRQQEGPPLFAKFSAAISRPPAFYNHFEAQQDGDELQPPYGVGHMVHGTSTARCLFAIDTMCRPISVVKRSMLTDIQQTNFRQQRVETTLADKDAPKVISTEAVTVELVVHWNAKRRTIFLDCMIWDDLPDKQDLIISMPDALDTGMIAFALPHEWRRSWLGTAAFSNQLPLALRNDKSMAAAMHHQFVMAPEDENLIDITERIAMSKAHLITDATTLTATQQYWLKVFPKLAQPIPKIAHPDLPKFNPPFNEALMETYLDKKDSKTPRTSPKLQEKINEVLGCLNEEGITNTHANPVGVASYVVLIPKPDGSLRICINFCKVNRMLLKHHYPLPCCADLLNQLAKRKYYAKVDLRHGFYNFDVADSAKWLTSTIAPGHALTWNKVPQGLAPVPSWFQWAMCTVLGDYVSTLCLVYLDDLIIMGDTPEELQQNIRLILARLDQYDLRINIQKCDFDINSSIEFLGHTICDGKISPGPKSSKILSGIVNPNHEAEPKDKLAKLNTLIGIVNWFSKYIPNCQQQLLPLLDARANTWTWGVDQELAFKHFKDILSNLQPLYLPSGGTNKLEIHTDASKDGWFAVLFEDTGIGTASERLHVIAYAGGVFRGPQISWSILQKEMMAVYQAHLKFDSFIRLHEFKLVVDNKTMTYCETSADLMVQRWYLRIQHYMSEIVHLPGVLNILPDAGSRLLHLEHPNHVSAQFQSITSAINSAQHAGPPVTRSKTAQLTAQLLTNRMLASLIVPEVTDDNACDDTSIRNINIRQSSHASTSTSASSQHWSSQESSRGSASCSTQLPHGPNSCSTVLLSVAEQDDMLDSASTLAHAASISPSAYARLAAEPSQAQAALPITPDHLLFIRQCHGGCAGHHGRDETIRKLQQAGHSWPTRFIDVARYIASCETCQLHRLKVKQPYAMYKTILTHAPLFGRWHMDFLSINQQCSFTNSTKILVMQEERSRYVMLHACKAETSIEVVIAMLVTFAIFGIPESIRSDNAPNLCEASVKEFLTLTGITHDFSIPHQAHSNGMVESTVGETKRLLRMLCYDLSSYGKWSLLLPLVQRQLNSITRSSIGTTANNLVFGQRVNLDRYVIPVAPMVIDDAIRASLAKSDTVQNFTDLLAIAQQDILHKADLIRVQTLNDRTRQRPLLEHEQLQEGQLVLCPWNDTNTRPAALSANFMGPYVVVHVNIGQNTVTLAHTIQPPPSQEPATLQSSVTELRLFNDTLGIIESELPELRFRNHTYHDNQTKPIHCILTYRQSLIIEHPDNHVSNMQYEVRFDTATSLTDTAWLPYDAVCHTFAFESFWQIVQRELSGHKGIALPADQRLTHQTRSTAASIRRRNVANRELAASAFNQETLSFHD